MLDQLKRHLRRGLLWIRYMDSGLRVAFAPDPAEPATRLLAVFGAVLGAARYVIVAMFVLPFPIAIVAGDGSSTIAPWALAAAALLGAAPLLRAATARDLAAANLAAEQRRGRLAIRLGEVRVGRLHAGYGHSGAVAAIHEHGRGARRKLLRAEADRLLDEITGLIEAAYTADLVRVERITRGDRDPVWELVGPATVGDTTTARAAHRTLVEMVVDRSRQLGRLASTVAEEGALARLSEFAELELRQVHTAHMLAALHAASKNPGAAESYTELAAERVAALRDAHAELAR